VTEQLALVPDEPKLTDRQQYVLDLVETTSSATATFVGMMLHGRRGKHDEHRPCVYCEDEGRGVLVALRKKGLVVRRRSGLWQSLRKNPARNQTDEIPY